MCTDLGPDIQEQEHGRILPALMGAMKDSANPRVQAHASAAVVNFTDNCDKDIIAQYLDTLISSLIGQLQHNHRAVRESALPALSSLADCAQQHFVKYYSQVSTPHPTISATHIDIIGLSESGYVLVSCLLKSECTSLLVCLLNAWNPC
jgi:hypothetical protein